MSNEFKGYASMGLPAFITLDGKEMIANSGVVVKDEGLSHVKDILEWLRDNSNHRELAISALMQLNKHV